ncbi:beta-ketoacyl synthase N-terminal-like domain-containing protein [Streptomyces sp. NPDC049541]|uniref:beta-ketoacyl synthase N-terminal-like domain-containing protein n=1 Tax=Streptomyces sp. NPDC049541 TaxID=3365594 RepID=UPI0037AE7EC5
MVHLSGHRPSSLRNTCCVTYVTQRCPSKPEEVDLSGSGSSCPSLNRSLSSGRLPGDVDSVGSFWELLRVGRDAVGHVPPGRWDPDDMLALEREASRPPVWRGGFLDGELGAFDAEFFGLSPEEAELVDPQHQLLLEVAWEACEHAGLPAVSLTDTVTGVFAGLCNPDHAAYVPWLPSGGGPYFVTGNQFGTAAGRLSHVVGLRGPSIARGHLLLFRAGGHALHAAAASVAAKRFRSMVMLLR